MARWSHTDKWKHVDEYWGCRYMINFSMHKKITNRVTVTGNIKTSLKTESNLFGQHKGQRVEEGERSAWRGRLEIANVHN